MQRHQTSPAPANMRVETHKHSPTFDIFSSSEDDMSSSSQVSYAALSAVGGHRNKPSDPSAVSAHDKPDVELYGPVFSQCQAGSGKTLFYKDPVNVQHI